MLVEEGSLRGSRGEWTRRWSKREKKRRKRSWRRRRRTIHLHEAEVCEDPGEEDSEAEECSEDREEDCFELRGAGA
eukprot:767082-Hanusia_phi.AAC.3